MKNTFTFGNAIALFSVLVIPLLLWGFKVEREQERSKSIEKIVLRIDQENREFRNKSNNDYINILEKLHNIELLLKDKQDR